MYSGYEVCRKITEIQPELGSCGRDLNVAYDDRLQAWRISHDKGGRHALTFIEADDVDRCLDGSECLSLICAAHQLRERSHTFR